MPHSSQFTVYSLHCHIVYSLQFTTYNLQGALIPIGSAMYFVVLYSSQLRFHQELGGVAAPPYSSQLKSCGDLTPPQVAQKVVEAPHFPQFLRLRRAKISFPIPLSRLQAPCLAPFTLGCPPQTHGTARR